MYYSAVVNDGDQLEPDEEEKGWQKSSAWVRAAEVICLLERNHPEELVWINVLRALRELHSPSDQQVLSQKLDDSDDDGEDSDDIPEGTSESGAVDEEATAPSSLPQQGKSAHDSPHPGDATGGSAPKKLRTGKGRADSPGKGLPGDEQTSDCEGDDDVESLGVSYQSDRDSVDVQVGRRASSQW